MRSQDVGTEQGLTGQRNWNKRPAGWMRLDELAEEGDWDWDPVGTGNVGGKWAGD